MTGPNTPPWVVGDARQAIYRFRGAEPASVTRFADDFPNAVTFRLRDNYRSAPEVVETINHLAALLENPDGNPLTSAHWRARRDIQAVGTPVRRASANSDLAEREGVEAVVESWLASAVPADTHISVPRVWGGSPPEAVTMYALGAETCRLRTYVQDHLGIRFYTRDRPLYPELIRSVYAALSRVVSHQLETGRRVTPAEVQQISDEMWPPDAFSEHPHVAIYRPRVRRWAEQFAEALAQFDVNEGSLSLWCGRPTPVRQLN